MSTIEEITFLYSTVLSNQEYNTLETNKERISFILTKVKPLQEFRNEVFGKVVNYCKTHRKNLQKSRDLRAKGVEYFLAQNFDESKQCFTEAILYAPSPSKTNHCNELSIAYRFRSILFLEIKDYESALFDINQSLEFHPIEDTFLQKFHCLRFLGKFGESDEVINELMEMWNKNKIKSKEISIEKLKKLKQLNGNDLQIYGNGVEDNKEPEMSDNFWIHKNCEVITTKDKGRVLMAKKFIPINSKIIIEKPYMVVIKPKLRTKYCNNCHKSLDYRIYPCSDCIEVVFCGKQCAEDAINDFHRAECGFTGLLSDFGVNGHLIYRLFARMEALNVYNLEKFVNQCKAFDINKYLYNKRQKTTPFKNKTKTERDEEFKVLMTFENHNKERNRYQDTINCLEAIEPTILLNYRRILNFDIVLKLDYFVLFTDLMVSLIRRDMCNGFGWYEPQNPSFSIAHMFCIVCTFVNHNCDPNADWMVINRRQTFTTIKDVSAGDEISISYGPDMKIPFVERQEKMKKRYFFKCLCDKCKSDEKIFNTQRDSFKHIINNVNNGKKISDSLNILNAKNIMEMTETDIILEDIRLLVNSYIKFGKYSNAIEYYEYFNKSIERETTSEDLLLWIDIYSKYLKDGSVDNRLHWNSCFDLYSKLSERLSLIPNEFDDNLIQTLTEEYRNLEEVYYNKTFND